MTGKRNEVKVSAFDVADYLRDDNDAESFLTLCVEQSPLDGRMIASALGAIARAKGIMSKVAELSGLSRESLYKALSGSRDPGFTTILKVLSALGYSLAISHKDSSTSAARTPLLIPAFYPGHLEQPFSPIALSSGVAIYDAVFDMTFDEQLVRSADWTDFENIRGYLVPSAAAASSADFSTPQAMANVSTLAVRTLQ